jgi:hypothetical protein
LLEAPSLWVANRSLDRTTPLETCSSPACTVKHLARVDTLRDKLLTRSDDVGDDQVQGPGPNRVRLK